MQILGTAGVITTDDIYKALDANAIVESVWLGIVSIIGDQDPAVCSVSAHHGFYYLPQIQRDRLKHIIPFIIGEMSTTEKRKSLMLPAKSTFDLPTKCSKCGGPYHESTGAIITSDNAIVACGPCAGRFYAWQLKKYGWVPLTPKKQKKAARKERRRKLKEQLAKERQEKLNQGKQQIPFRSM